MLQRFHATLKQVQDSGAMLTKDGPAKISPIIHSKSKRIERSLENLKSLIELNTGTMDLDFRQNMAVSFNIHACIIAILKIIALYVKGEHAIRVKEGKLLLKKKDTCKTGILPFVHAVKMRVLTKDSHRKSISEVGRLLVDLLVQISLDNTHVCKKLGKFDEDLLTIQSLDDFNGDVTNLRILNVLRVVYEQMPPKCNARDFIFSWCQMLNTVTRSNLREQTNYLKLLLSLLKGNGKIK